MKKKKYQNIKMEANKKNQKLEETDLPRVKKSVGFKWMPTIEYKTNGTIKK